MQSDQQTFVWLAQLIDFVLTVMDKQMHTGMILIDLQKAINTSDHRVLLETVKDFGFRTSVIKWFEAYLSNRKLLVCIDYVFSEAGTLKCGVPQSSILGPLLFLFYVNDFLNHYQKLVPLCMQMTLVFSTNMRMLKK